MSIELKDIVFDKHGRFIVPEDYLTLHLICGKCDQDSSQQLEWNITNITILDKAFDDYYTIDIQSDSKLLSLRFGTLESVVDFLRCNVSDCIII